MDFIDDWNFIGPYGIVLDGAIYWTRWDCIGYSLYTIPTENADFSFFLWDFNYPVGFLGPVIYSLMKNRSIISPQRLVRTDDRSWIGGGVGGARDWPLWREITRGYTRGYYHQMPYETLGVSHFNGFFLVTWDTRGKKDVFFFFKAIQKHGDRSEKPWLIGYESIAGHEERLALLGIITNYTWVPSMN